MVKGPKDQSPTPAQTATPPPNDPYRRTIDQDWAISILMELQKNVSAHDATLSHVASDVTSLKATVGRLEKVIYAATAVAVIAGGFIAWSVNTAKEVYLANHADRTVIPVAPAAAAPIPATPEPKPKAP